MARGRPTSTLRLDRKVLKKIVENCSNQDAMREFLLVLPMQLALGKITLEEVEARWREAGCILWLPTDPKERHVDVGVQTGSAREVVMIHVHRVVWTATRQVISAQGEQLRGDEEIHHICKNNGESNTARGVCLNPHCLIKGDAGTRHRLRVTHKLLEKYHQELEAIYARNRRAS